MASDPQCPRAGEHRLRDSVGVDPVLAAGES
jgi:hypothetical protein